MNGKRLAAAYVRVACVDYDHEERLRQQVGSIREYAERNGYEIVQVYSDRGVSGHKADRPGLNALLVDACAGQFSAVIIAHPSRLFRNMGLLERYIALLRDEFSVELIIVNGSKGDAT